MSHRGRLENLRPERSGKAGDEIGIAFFHLLSLC